MENNVMRLVAVQHLRSAYGIKIKSWNKNKASSCKTTSSNSTKVFGAPLGSLPYCYMECGRVPRFLVDACGHLVAHVDTEGLFRKSGSVVRLKALRAKLDAGEECLAAAPPCDVAGLVKQFFRELPEPVLPTELQDAFFKAQQLPTEEERTSATMLLTCVLSERNISVLRHFFDFLQCVAQRSAENKMDSSNLSVIFAPNLFHSGDAPEKRNANMEKRLKLQAATVHCFIENANDFGVLPQFLQEKVPAMMGCETGVFSPSHGEEEDLNSGMKRKNGRSFGHMVSGALSMIKTNRTPTKDTQADNLVFSSATPVIATPSSKRKLPFEPRNSFGFSNKKRRSIKKSLGIDLLPNALFSGSTTPGSAYSASGVLDSSSNTLSSAGRSKRQTVTSARRKSKRFSSKHINRVESGRAGCFSPKVGKKEDPSKSLRKRFSLGKSSKGTGSESIGLRLATQKSTTSFLCPEVTDFGLPNLPRNPESKSSKYFSKSEDNLLTPQCDSRAHRASWIEETPLGAQAFSRGSFTDIPMSARLKSNYTSEPVIVISKPSPGNIRHMKLCCASSAESLETTETLKTDADVTETSVEEGGEGGLKPSDDILFTPPVRGFSVDTETPVLPTQQSRLGNEQNVTFGQMDMAALTPLHIDSVDFDSSVHCSPVIRDKSAQFDSHGNSMLRSTESVAEQMSCSRLIDALDVQSPHFTLGVSSTPYKLLEKEPVTPTKAGTLGSRSHETEEFSMKFGSKVQSQPFLSLENHKPGKRRVADHIQHFNKLTLYSPTDSKDKLIRSPLKFQRTPVRQTVRRINSLVGEGRRPTLTVEKSLSLESGLSPHSKLQPQQRRPQATRANSMLAGKKPPPVPPKKQNSLVQKPASSALGDMTNKVQPKIKAESSASNPTGTQKDLIQQVAKKDTNHYRGSPRNPLNVGQLLSATKPVDL